MFCLSATFAQVNLNIILRNYNIKIKKENDFFAKIFFLQCAINELKLLKLINLCHRNSWIIEFIKLMVKVILIFQSYCLILKKDKNYFSPPPPKKKKRCSENPDIILVNKTDVWKISWGVLQDGTTFSFWLLNPRCFIIPFLS